MPLEVTSIIVGSLQIPIPQRHIWTPIKTQVKKQKIVEKMKQSYIRHQSAIMVSAFC